MILHQYRRASRAGGRLRRGGRGTQSSAGPVRENKKTLAAMALLEREEEGLTRKAVELAMRGDPIALRLCLQRILPPCRERAVKFALPPIESPADIAASMKAVTAALAEGTITPGEAGRIAAMVDTFIQAIETRDFERRLQYVEESFARPSQNPGRSASGQIDSTTSRGVLLQIRCRYASRRRMDQLKVVGQASPLLGRAELGVGLTTA